MENSRSEFVAISLIARRASDFAVGIIVFLGGRADERFEITELLLKSRNTPETALL